MKALEIISFSIWSSGTEKVGAGGMEKCSGLNVLPLKDGFSGTCEGDLVWGECLCKYY